MATEILGDASDTHAVVGHTVGNYHVLKQLGAGGMGAVYVAEHSLLGNKVAMKFLLPELSHNQDIVQRFFNEAKIATAISHPSIVRVFDFGYHQGGSAYIVMELLQGESLEARLERLGRLPVGQALRVAHHCASALAAAHDAGVVHRDIKPDNIFLVPDPLVEGGERAKLLDFGIAKLADPDGNAGVKTRAGSVMGTPLYMAPEQCRGAGGVDHRADVYALGCVLFHMLAGRPPFQGEGPGEIMVAHMTRPAPSPSELEPSIPPAVDAVVARCLAKEPDQRFATMAELEAAVAALEPLAMRPSERATVAAVAPGSDPPGSVSTPSTTLSSAAAQSVQTQHIRSSRAISAIAVAAVAVVGAVIALVVAMGDGAGPGEVARPAQPAVIAVPDASPVTAPGQGPASEDTEDTGDTEDIEGTGDITVLVESEPPGATVFVGEQDEPLGTTPYQYRRHASPDTVVLRLVLAGYEEARVDVPGDMSGVVMTTLGEVTRAPDKTRRRRPARQRDRDRPPRGDPPPSDDDPMKYR